MKRMFRHPAFSTAIFIVVVGVAALAIFKRQPSPADARPEPFKARIEELKTCGQLVLVTVDDWSSVDAQVRCFERTSARSPWSEVPPKIPACVGRNGLAWGIGLHGTCPSGSSLVKREGDGRAPAGVFSLREVFGYADAAEARITRFPYRQVTRRTEGVDDSNSRWYNRLVDMERVEEKDWKSAETMLRADGLYRWGVFVDHNWQQVPQGGSCIFLHIWEGPGKGTAGCTSMAGEHMEAVVRWLDREKHPLLVQLPKVEYERLKGQWLLP